MKKISYGSNTLRITYDTGTILESAMDVDDIFIVHSPTNFRVTNIKSNGIGIAPRIEVDMFASTMPRESHVSTSWTLVDVATGAGIWSSVNDTENLVNIQIPPGVLSVSTNYDLLATFHGTTVDSTPGRYRFITASEEYEYKLTPLADCPAIPRHSNSVQLQDGRVMVVCEQLTYIHDPLTDTWTRMTDLPIPRYGFGMSTLLNGDVMVTGGSINAGGAYYSEVHVYDVSTDTWSTRASLPATSSWHRQVTLQDGRVLIVGKYIPVGSMSGVCYVYSPTHDEWTSVAPLPSPRYGGGIALLDDGKVIYSGGANSLTTDTLTTDIYDPVNDTWSTIANCPIAVRVSNMMPLTTGKIMRIGGGTSSASYTNVPAIHILDVAANTWSTLPNLTNPLGYTMGAIKLLDGSVLIYGGDSTETKVYLLT